MNQKKIAHYFFLALLLLLLYLTFIIIKPYATYVLMSLVLAFSFYPAYLKTKKILKSESLSALIIIFLVLLILIVPLILVSNSLISQAGSAYVYYDQEFLSEISVKLSEKLGVDIDINSELRKFFLSGINFMISNAHSFLESITEIIIGFFIMFVGMFYLLKKGHKTNEIVLNYIPLRKNYKEDLITEVKNVTHGVVYSQVFISLVQGTLVGISFAIFGVKNPVFWAFISAIFSFLPVVGPPVIWIPAAAIKLLSGSVGAGIGIALFNGILTMNIDNFMRPRIVGGKSKIHPFVTLIGIIGGLKVFGFIGLLLGPMIIALFSVLLKYFNKEF